MSSYTPLGYQANPPSPLVFPPPEAPDSLARRIDAAIAAVPQDKRGTFIGAADLTRGSLTVMVKVGENVRFLGRVTKPWRGPAEAEALVRVNFAAAVTGGVTLRLSMSDYYHALRAERDGMARNSRLRAAVKAFALHQFKAQPYLDGGRWFHRG